MTPRATVVFEQPRLSTATLRICKNPILYVAKWDSIYQPYVMTSRALSGVKLTGSGYTDSPLVKFERSMDLSLRRRRI